LAANAGQGARLAAMAHYKRKRPGRLVYGQCQSARQLGKQQRHEERKKQSTHFTNKHELSFIYS
jgi:hypothetical protein